MIRTTDKLYECKGCGILVRNTMGGCPNCEKQDDGTKHILTFDGETVEKKRSWYNTVRLE